jgi:hypothetical protein
MHITRCPRCQRPSTEWQVDADSGDAGCPCGEVIAIGKPLPTEVSPTKPAMWSESFSATGWSAQLGAEMRDRWRGKLAFGALTIAMTFGLGALRHGIFVPGTPLENSGIFALSVVIVLGAIVFSLARRQPSFFRDTHLTLENGRLLIQEGSRVLLDAPLSDLERFEVGLNEEGSGAKKKKTGLIQAVGVTGAPIGKQLRVRTHDARYVAERLNEVLSTQGLAANRGYRGEQPRVAAEEPHVRVTTETKEELETQAEQLETPARKKTHTLDR